MKTACKVFLFLLALMYGALATAASVRMDAGDLSIVLHSTPCTEPKVLSIIEEPYRPSFRSANVTHKGKPLKACWMAVPDRRAVLVADETGDYGAVPMALFKPVVEM